MVSKTLSAQQIEEVVWGVLHEDTVPQASGSSGNAKGGSEAALAESESFKLHLQEKVKTGQLFRMLADVGFVEMQPEAREASDFSTLSAPTLTPTRLQDRTRLEDRMGHWPLATSLSLTSH
eukprot:1196170-Rhodomonas_salina.1